MPRNVAGVRCGSNFCMFQMAEGVGFAPADELPHLLIFDQDRSKLPAEIIKLGRRRLIHLHPGLNAWLVPHRKT